MDFSEQGLGQKPWELRWEHSARPFCRGALRRAGRGCELYKGEKKNNGKRWKKKLKKKHGRSCGAEPALTTGGAPAAASGCVGRTLPGRRRWRRGRAVWAGGEEEEERPPAASFPHQPPPAPSTVPINAPTAFWGCGGGSAVDLPPPNPTACTCPAGNNCCWRLQPPQLSWGLIAAPLSPPQPSPGPHRSSWHPGGAPPLRFSEAAARIQLWGWGHARSPSPGAPCGGGGGGDDHGSQCAGGCRPCPQMSPRPQGAAELNAARAAAPASPRAGLAWAAALLGGG